MTNLSTIKNQSQQNLDAKITSGRRRWFWCCILVVIFCYWMISPVLLATDSSLVTQEIRYHIPEAGEVYLIWGINGWSVVPREIRPKETTITNSVLRTPMLCEGETFSAEVVIPYHATLNYGFIITKKLEGSKISIWDGSDNQDKD